MRNWAWCVGVAVTVSLTMTRPADAAEWEVTQITDHDEPFWYQVGGIGEISVSGDYLVWWDRFDGWGREVLLYDGQEIRKIGGSTVDEGAHFEISGQNVVWAVGDAFDGGLLLYDGHSTESVGTDFASFGYQVSGPYVAGIQYDARLENGPFAFLYDHSKGQFTSFLQGPSDVQRGPRVSGSHMLWWEPDGIHLYDIASETKRLLPDTQGVRYPELSEDFIVWRNGGNDAQPEDYEIFVYDLESEVTTQLTDNEFEDAVERLSGKRIAWKQFDGHDWEIFLYDGIRTERLTDNDYDDGDGLRISESYVAWTTNDGNDTEVFVYNGSEVIQLTDNQFEEESMILSGTYVAWYQYDGNDLEIFAYDGSGVAQLTDNDYDERYLALGGSRIAWAGYDGEDPEVFVATHIVPEPGLFTLLAAGAAVLLLRYGKQILR